MHRTISLTFIGLTTVQHHSGNYNRRVMSVCYTVSFLEREFNRDRITCIYDISVFGKRLSRKSDNMV